MRLESYTRNSEVFVPTHPHESYPASLCLSRFDSFSCLLPSSSCSIRLPFFPSPLLLFARAGGPSFGAGVASSSHLSLAHLGRSQSPLHTDTQAPKAHFCWLAAVGWSRRSLYPFSAPLVSSFACAVPSAVVLLCSLYHFSALAQPKHFLRVLLPLCCVSSPTPLPSSLSR